MNYRFCSLIQKRHLKLKINKKEQQHKLHKILIFSKKIHKILGQK